MDAYQRRIVDMITTRPSDWDTAVRAVRAVLVREWPIGWTLVQDHEIAIMAAAALGGARC